MQKLNKLNKNQDGIFYGPSITGGPVTLKLWKSDKKENRPNVCVFGHVGEGKQFDNSNLIISLEKDVSSWK
jgi:hypothetical protein